jgi:L,D-transpeptidase YcbB
VIRRRADTFAHRAARVFAACLAVLTATAGCHERRAPKYVPQDVPAVLGVKTPTVQSTIRTLVDSGEVPAWVTPARWKVVRALYAIYDDAPLWIEEGGIKERASALLSSLEEAPLHALRTDAYPIDSLRRWVNAKRLDSGATAQAIANADILLTAAYVGYASDMLIGQVDPTTVSQEWHIPARIAAVDSALVHTLQDSSMAEGLALMAPQDSEYTLLKSEYARYRAIDSVGGWKRVEQGMSPEELAARLTTEGDKVRSEDSVFVILARWQRRHNLDGDGRVGRMTFAALNVTAAERAQQIATNMERHRWLPRALGQRYVYVNVPAFRLDAFDSGRRVLSMRVVVGAEYDGHSTPVFADSMRYVVFRPYWKPTETILKSEILPKLKADTTFLARNDMEYGFERGDRVLRQRPGPHNSLGLVKFLFPNDYNIYLHDTNEKELFDQVARAVSHGCIRLEKPAKLAEYVLGWSADSVKASMDSGPNNRSITVANKVPVYIVYFTVYERDGRLYFADDVYHRDVDLNGKMSGDLTR